jgi:hypothetical protein
VKIIPYNGITDEVFDDGVAHKICICFSYDGLNVGPLLEIPFVDDDGVVLEIIFPVCSA